MKQTTSFGTMANKASRKRIDVTILSGDRDTFQLATDKITIRIPRTKAGKTEEDDYDKEKILEQYGIEPKLLIEVKGLMGDKSDNIPGVQGIGEKTALNIIQKYKTIERLYENLENGKATEIKGKTREKLLEGKESAFLSKQLGTINTKSPIDVEINELKRKEWDKEKVLEIFTKLRFNKYIDRFSLRKEELEINPFQEIEIIENKEIEKAVNEIKKDKKIIYYFNTIENNNEENIIKKEIKSISIIIKNKVYYIEGKENIKKHFKQIFEDKEIEKIGYKLKENYILLKQIGIELRNFSYDVEIAGYIIDSIKNRYDIETLSIRYLNLELSRYIVKNQKNEQLDLFSMASENNEEEKNRSCLYVYAISKLYEVMTNMIKEIEAWDLFKNIEMPTAEVLAKMQYTGIWIDKEELIEYGRKLKFEIEEKTKKIYQLCRTRI